ncbi:MAG: T9SS type A sorting domain-containing protein [Saprospiraceae bacterium]|nr:T9SS type A sorting domain-containing protein [Saprospiraceae bacterium]
MIKPLCLLLPGILFILTNLQATSFYTSPSASNNGDGSLDDPWTLQTALDHPAALLPGDTVWMRGGVYMHMVDAQTSFRCMTNGLPNAPIIFRNNPGEHAVLDGNLQYTLYLGLGQCSYTWFWGIEVTNSFSTDRDHNIPGGVSCTAANIKFINMIVHDTGIGIDTWKNAKNTETYGCIIYHIGNNLNNNGNKEGHGHGMYLQNDTVGVKRIYNNIIFSTYGYGMHLWQTTTTSAIGNFDIRYNILFNGGAASENLGGVGNNVRTHNFFAVANGAGHPIENTIIKHNYTWSSPEMPRPSVNAFGLNSGVRNMVLDSNILTCQTRLGWNNAPIFEATVKGNRIIAGIPAVYGYYLWGFTFDDFPENEYIPTLSTTGQEVFVLPNEYESGRAHIAIYNWENALSVDVDISTIGLKAGDQFEVLQVLDLSEKVIAATYDGNGVITIPMTGHSLAHPVGSSQQPISTFPTFGAFVLRKTTDGDPTSITPAVRHEEVMITPNPSRGSCRISTTIQGPCHLMIVDLLGRNVYQRKVITPDDLELLDLTALPKGQYIVQVKGALAIATCPLLIHE